MAPIVQIMSMFAVVKMHGEISFPGFLVFLILFLTSFTGLLVLQTVWKLRVISENLLFSWRGANRNSKYNRRKVIDSKIRFEFY